MSGAVGAMMEPDEKAASGSRRSKSERIIMSAGVGASLKVYEEAEW